MLNHYIVRFRQTRGDGMTVLIVEDEHGVAWLYSAGILHSGPSPCDSTGRTACDHPATRSAEASRWVRLPEVAPYTIEGLR